jgi:hypothetical protein
MTALIANKGDVGLKSDMIILRICGTGMYVMIVDMEYFSLTKLLRSSEVNNNVLIIIGVHQSMSKANARDNACHWNSIRCWLGSKPSRKNIPLPPLMSVS